METAGCVRDARLVIVRTSDGYWALVENYTELTGGRIIRKHRDRERLEGLEGEKKDEK